ncbi:MAG: GNAT family N-acetyltransferase [Mycobacteriales bacterium]
MTVRIRPGVPADVHAVARVRTLSWQAAYAGIVTQPALDAMDPEVTAARWGERGFAQAGPTVDVADGDAGEVLGFVMTGAYRAEQDDPIEPAGPPGAGEVWAIYVLPECLSTGVGRALLDSGLARLAEQHLDPVLLWVLRDNRRARRFYQRAGFAADGATHEYEIGGAVLPEVRYRR